ncbi:MAG: rRNA maturation RNase YbeY [Candidatus Babeliaceae bacterium]
MILIKNTQRKVILDTQKLEQNAQVLLDSLRYSDYDLGIWITTNKTIRLYNKTYRHKDKATDILSFMNYPQLQAGKRIRPIDGDKNLGDLIISAEYVVQEALKYNVTLEQRLQVLLVHGICHLLGYDHIEDADYRRMRAKEAYLLKKLRSSSQK